MKKFILSFLIVTFLFLPMFINVEGENKNDTMHGSSESYSKILQTELYPEIKDMFSGYKYKLNKKQSAELCNQVFIKIAKRFDGQQALDIQSSQVSVIVYSSKTTDYYVLQILLVMYDYVELIGEFPLTMEFGKHFIICKHNKKSTLVRR